MPYPDKPHAPRPTAGPNDCQAAKAALIESYDEAEARFNDAFARLKDLAAAVCRDAGNLRTYYDQGGANYGLDCVQGMERLCARLTLLLDLFAEQACELEVAVIDAVSAIDCNLPDWRDRWRAAGELLVNYGALRRDLVAATRAGAGEYDKLRRGPCQRYFFAFDPNPPDPNADASKTPWYDGADGQWHTGGGGPAHAPAPCGCGSP